MYTNYYMFKQAKPEPIMPLILPEFSNFFTCYSYFISMPSPIIPIKFVVSVKIMSTIHYSN